MMGNTANERTERGRSHRPERAISGSSPATGATPDGSCARRQALPRHGAGAPQPPPGRPLAPGPSRRHGVLVVLAGLVAIGLLLLPLAPRRP